MTPRQLVLSIFPGIDLLGRAFELEGFCVVRGPDTIFGGDIRGFRPPAGVFWGVIGGPPCQDYSCARRGRPPSGASDAMLAEFARVVREAAPAWWLLENVPACPDLATPGYARQRAELRADWFSGVRRLRHFQYGHLKGAPLELPRGRPVAGAEPAALANDHRTFAELCRLQGLPASFALPDFTVAGAKRAVGNGVPLVLGRLLARAVLTAHGLAAAGDPPRLDFDRVETRRCACGCGRPVKPHQRCASATCRKRAHRAQANPRRTIDSA